MPNAIMPAKAMMHIQPISSCGQNMPMTPPVASTAPERVRPQAKIEDQVYSRCVMVIKMAPSSS